MNIESFRDFCLSLPDTTESMPFGGDVLVFKVSGKMFALTDIDLFKSINLKCDPEKAIELRTEYTEVSPGYHMNKKHWNTVDMDGMIPDKQIIEWILDSYKLVVQTLKTTDREVLMKELQSFKIE
ncbi:MAG: MmcQ/YjbR family DNA-binding protein [Chitinophagales bacterium]